MISAIPFLSALIILSSCNNNQLIKKSQFSFETNRLDTSKPYLTTTFPGKTYPQIFAAAFHADTKAKQDDITYIFHSYELGKIKIESGKIIACDPIVMHDSRPFTQVFPIGQFLVTLAIAKTSNYERVAFSRITFSNNPVSKWELALKEGQKPIPLKDTSFYCYGVDAGTGIFIDSIANKSFNQKSHAEWKDVFITKAEKNGNVGYIHEFETHNLATFSTGYGDGCYATYVGIDNAGNVCQLLTDFGLVDWWKLDK
ncbi:DUF4241 domain-containing protein [Terrimonas alba]|uniref:DUF4241 domain-containing protein n=1 Tax=Terrimonas alba TaxID=3349636 RepID=UPI0035F2B004